MATIRDGGHTIGASGADYTTITSWESTEQGIDNDLVNGDEILQAQVFDETIIDQFTIDGFTVGSSNYIEITTYAGAEHNGTPGTGAKIRGTTNWGDQKVDDAYTRIVGLEVLQDTSKGNAINLLGNGDDCTIDSCILKAAGGRGIDLNSTTHRTVIKNNLIYECDIGIKCTGYNDDTTIYHNTIADCVNEGIDLIANNDAKVYISHTVCSGNATDFQMQGFSLKGGDYNAALDNTQPGTNSFDLSADPFVDSTNDDYTIDNTSALYDAGGASGCGIAYDCIGTSRPQNTNYDVGWFEVEATGDLTATPSDTNTSNWSDTRDGTLTYSAAIEDDVNT